MLFANIYLQDSGRRWNISDSQSTKCDHQDEWSPQINMKFSLSRFLSNIPRLKSFSFAVADLNNRALVEEIFEAFEDEVVPLQNRLGMILTYRQWIIIAVLIINV